MALKRNDVGIQSINILMSVSCLGLFSKIDRLIRSENSNSAPKKYIKDKKLKLIVEAVRIPIINNHSIINLHQTPAFLFSLLISGSDDSDFVSSSLKFLTGMELLILLNFDCSFNFVSFEPKSLRYGSSLGSNHLSEVVLFLNHFKSFKFSFNA